jgi:hypothetical protein
MNAASVIELFFKTNIYKGWYKSNPSLFSPRKYTDSYNEIYIYDGHIVYEFEIIFPQSPLHYQHNFSTFAWDAGHVKISTQASELFVHAVPQLIICKMMSLDCILHGAKKMEVPRR